MKDPRAQSEERLVPPDPLPHVSRKALKRIGDGYLPPPEECRYCGHQVELVNHREIYGREYGDWPYAYLCRGCRAYVGLHPNTDVPLGTLADAELRRARNDNKATFIALTAAKNWTRKQAYQWLADQLDINLEDCHWGHFELAKCQAAGTLCGRELMRIAGHE